MGIAYGEAAQDEPCAECFGCESFRTGTGPWGCLLGKEVCVGWFGGRCVAVGVSCVSQDHRDTGEAEDTGIQPWPAAAEGQPSRDGQRGAEGGQSGTAPTAPRG